MYKIIKIKINVKLYITFFSKQYRTMKNAMRHFNLQAHVSTVSLIEYIVNRFYISTR